MASVLQNKVAEALSGLQVAWLGSDLIAAGVPVEVTEQQGQVRLRIRLGFPLSAAAVDAFRQKVLEALRPTMPAVVVEVEWAIHSHAVQGGLAPVAGVKNIIAVASGKGGVGKSTVAVNIAMALQQDGARVGILDADIYGPSQPRLLGAEGQRPVSLDGKSFQPLLAHGLQFISIGCLIDEDQPAVWRGPMVTQALTQLLTQTAWQDLDYLVVDMPPGTGDIQLTLGQRVPVSGAVIVTTPQDIALADARKGLKMFQKVNIPVLGIVENMSVYVCPECGHASHLFGEGGGQRMASDYDVPLLGHLPLDAAVRRDSDAGLPVMLAQPDSAVADNFRDIARSVAGRLSLRRREYRARMPGVVVEERKPT